MEYSVSLLDQGATDMLRSLGAQMLDHAELHGRVRFVEAPPEPGTMGPIITELHLLVDDPDHLQTVGSVLVTWILARRRKVKICLTRKDTKAEFLLTNAGADTEVAVRKVLAQIIKELAENPEPDAHHSDGKS